MLRAAAGLLAALLMVPFRFPTQLEVSQADAQAPTAVPYSLFNRLFQRRDLGWLGE